MLTPHLWGSWCVGILVPSEDGALGRGASRSRRLSAFRCRLHQSRVVRAVDIMASDGRFLGTGETRVDTLITNRALIRGDTMTT